MPLGIGSKRIYELAKEYKISANAMLKMVRDMGFKPKSHMSKASPEIIAAMKKKFAEEKQSAKNQMEHRSQVTKASVEREKARLIKKSKPPATTTNTAGTSKTAAPASPATPVKPGQQAKIGGITVSDSKSPVAGMMRKLEKKQKKKDRRKNRSRVVDASEVKKAFRSTMADLSGTKTKKKYRKEDGGVEEDTGPLNVLKVTEYVSLAELSKLMELKPAEVITKLFEMGMMATINQRLDMDTIEMVADEFGFTVEQMAEVGEMAMEAEEELNLVPRAPVVTIMGHVDHGKTSLLDYIRETNVVGGEAGAITQHIGAYLVDHDGGHIAFLDTPGHEAFTAMRARGAQITDIVVLVVAADDGVRPQTIEAIDHARAADVPIIVALNKIDKPTANVDNLRTQLSNYNLISEDWGGKTILVEVSAKTGEGIDKLLEMILLQAELLDLQADPTIRAQGVVIDARLERGRGSVTTVLVQKGSCKIGDPIVAGVFAGRIRTLSDDRDRPMKEVGPGFPAQITGLVGVPQAGDSFMKVKTDQEAKEIALKRSQLKREHDSRKLSGMTLDKIFDKIKEGQVKELKLIIKGDVDGSVEVLSDTLGKIATDEVRTNIIHSGVGAITESDVLLASASGAIIIGFHVLPDSRAREIARTEKVDIRLYEIIYEAEKEVKDALSGLLSPQIDEEFVGNAEVRDIFKVPKIGAIAGCIVKEGRIKRSDKVKLVRDGTIIYTGTIGSLRRFKDDAREVKEGFECGIGIENFNDIKVGDLIEAFQIVETARTL